MIALYIGLAEVSLVVDADRDVSHAASVTGDLATQIETMDEDEVENIFAATLAVLETDYTDSGRVSIDLLSLSADSSGNQTEIGYAKLGTGLSTKFDASSISSILLNDKSGIVIARVSYSYHSPSREFVGTPTLAETFMLKPRKSATIPFVNGGSSTISCTLGQSGGKPTVSCN